MSNGGLIGSLNEFAPSSSGRWSISTIRDYNLNPAIEATSITSLSQAGDLDIHYDFSNINTITHTSNNVTQVNDLSGNSKHATQSNTTYSPVIYSIDVSTPTGLRNSLYFSGNKTLNIPSPPPARGAYFIVGISDNSSSTKYLMYQALTNGTPGSLFLYQNIVSENVLLQASTYYGNSVFGSSIGNSIFLATYIYDSNYVEFRVNKTKVASYPHTKPSYSNTVYLGSSNATGGNGWQGTVCEIAFYDMESQDVDIKGVEDLLYSKWIA
jgi:hypothetical protein